MTRQRTTALKPAELGGQKHREHQLAKSDALNAVDVEVTFSAGTTAVAAHNLGHRYSGGWCVRQTTFGGIAAVIVVDPDYAEASGYDTTTNVVVACTAVSSDTYVLKVY